MTVKSPQANGALQSRDMEVRLAAEYQHAKDKDLYNDGYAAQKFRRVTSVEHVSLLDSLVKAFSAQPPAFLTQCLDGGAILVNGKPSRADVKVTRDDKVLIVFGGRKPTYWALNSAEYWAEGVQAWYDVAPIRAHSRHLSPSIGIKSPDPANPAFVAANHVVHPA